MECCPKLVSSPDPNETNPKPIENFDALACKPDLALSQTRKWPSELYIQAVSYWNAIR